MEPSCWTCLYRQDSELTLMGVCLYFLRVGRQPREIPAEIADKGCKFFKEKKPNG